MTEGEAGFKATDPKGKLVLIVDDDESILTLLEILVRRDGFQVATAATGEMAVEKLSQNPHALLLDLILPGTLSGLEVLKHLREKGGKAPPVLVITANDNKHPAVIEASKDPNVVQCLVKPIKQDVLLEALHRCLKTSAPAQKPAGAIKRPGGL